MRSPTARTTPGASVGEDSTLVAPESWRAIDFLSDLHLAEDTPLTFDALAGHLAHSSADAVFILGDLFETWIGDDMADRGFEQRCIGVLKEAASRLTVGFMAGNRDFLLGDALLAHNAVVRLADPTVISAFGIRVMVSHGDALCIDDTAYQRYRRVVRRKGMQKVFLSLPFGLRRSIGRAIRRRGGVAAKAHRVPGRAAVDLDTAASLRWLQHADAQTFVHGHTHAPSTHAMAAGVDRHVLSDWDLDAVHSPRAEVLRWTPSGFSRIPPER